MADKQAKRILEEAVNSLEASRSIDKEARLQRAFETLHEAFDDLQEAITSPGHKDGDAINHVLENLPNQILQLPNNVLSKKHPIRKFFQKYRDEWGDRNTIYSESDSVWEDVVKKFGNDPRFDHEALVGAAFQERRYPLWEWLKDNAPEDIPTVVSDIFINHVYSYDGGYWGRM